MAPTMIWRKKAVSTAVPSAVLQACTMSLVVAPLSEAIAKPIQEFKKGDMQAVDDGDTTDSGDAQSQSASLSTTTSDHEASDQENAPLAPATPTSWSKMLQLRREARKNGCPDDADVMRRVNLILNKLTLEKFESLYVQLLSCGISGKAHLEMLVQEISDKASTQPHFSAMYADLCERLGEVLEEDSQGRDLGDVLLIHSQRWFDQLIQLPTENSAGEEEIMEGAQAKHKARLLGNIRFTGELITRGIITSKTILLWSKDLLQEPLAPPSLEALTILLSIVGPKFDTPANPMHRQIREVFWQIRGITFDLGVPARVRYLVRDVLDSKDAGWVDVRAAVRTEAPKRLKEVHQEKPRTPLRAQAQAYAFAPHKPATALSENASMFVPMMAMAPMMMMPVMPMMPAQPAVRAADPPSSKKRGIKLQNKSVSKPVNDL